MRLWSNLQRKLKILLGFLFVREIVTDRYPNGSPKKIVLFRGEERYLRKVGEKTLDGKTNTISEKPL